MKDLAALPGNFFEALKGVARTPIHPGEHLREELETLQMSSAELSQQLDVPTNRVTAILNGQRSVTAETALRLAHFFGSSPEFWLNLQSLSARPDATVASGDNERMSLDVSQAAGANVSRKDYDDLEFITRDAQDFASLSREEQIQRMLADPWSALSGFKNKNGNDFPLSREAHRRFHQIAIRGLKQLGAGAHAHNLERVITELKSELSRRIFGELDITPENAHEVFTSALQKLEEGYKRLTYYVPCSIVAERTYPDFRIGPVEFTLRDQFFDKHKEAIHKATVEFGTPEADKIVLDRIQSFYSGFQWIACVTVPPCDPDISRRRAHEGIQKALDIFKLLVGGERAAHVKQAYDVTVPSRYAELVSSVPGSFSFTLGGKMHDAVTNDNWYQQVLTGPAWPLLESVLFNYWNAWPTLDEIQSRFLDALAWHSDAISERDSGAKIAKFWFSIERLLSVAPGTNITARAAVLTSNDAEEFKTKAKRLEFLYQRRSAVVHGAANRASEAWYLESVARSEEASKAVLSGYLYSIHLIQRFPGKTDRKKLAPWLTRLDTLAKQFRTPAEDC
jgi:antitoxin HigA-1